MELKGQVTISIEDFEKLKAVADMKEYGMMHGAQK